MIQVEAAHTYAVPLSEGFTYITNLNNWGRYWPNFVRIKDPANAHWSETGDTVTIVLRLLNRERELTMTLQEYMPNALVTYLSQQAGLPDAHHERHFHALSAGFEYRLVVTYEPRRGYAALFDRTLVRRAVTQAIHATIRNLETAFNHTIGD